MNKQETVLWQFDETSAPLPPLADMQDMSGTHKEMYMKLYRQLGPIFRISQNGQTVTLLAGPEANVLVGRYGQEFLVSGEFWEDFGKAMGGEEGMALTKKRDGEVNRARRAKSSSHYSRGKVLDQIPLMVEMVREQMKTWQEGESIPVLPQMQRIVAEQLGQLLVHHEVGDYLQDFITVLDTAIANAMEHKNFQAFAEPAFIHAKQRTDELARSILAKRRAEGTADRKLDLLDHVLADAAEHPELYSEAELKAACVGPFFAGIDTVAYTCCTMLYQLHKNPAVYKRIVAEVDEVFAQGSLDWEKLKGMQAIHGAALETLRTGKGQGTTNQKFRVVKPLTFAGYSLQMNAIVQLDADLAHNLPELFPEPDVFDIDRYHAPRNEHRQPGAFSPFGLGDHLCLGAGIAEIQLMANMATILHTYQIDIEMADGQPFSGFGLLSHGINQLRMQVVAR